MIDVEKINLEITNVRFGRNLEVNNGCMIISWSADIGFGTCSIYIAKDGTLMADSENMDTNTDKKFVRKLMELLVLKLQIK